MKFSYGDANIYIINYNQGKKVLDMCTNTNILTCLTAIDPPLQPPSDDSFFMGYNKYNKVIIQFPPNNVSMK